MDGYYSSDIATYENQAGLPSVPLTIIPLAGSGGYPDKNTNAIAEVSLDMEMVISMAPGLNNLYIFEGNNFDTVLGSMVTNTQIRQFSSSWGGYGFDSTGDGFLQQMAAQGQTFFQASGDGDAYTQPIPAPSDDLFVTSVGGTALAMDSTASNYVSESVWNSGFQSPGWYGNGAYTNGGTVGGYWGSGGGISSTYNIPAWQQGVNMAAVGGSTTKRNIPDVALAAVYIWVNYFNGLAGSFEGTSCAAPLWAGFAALVNQQATADGKPPIGYINPALYAIGESSSLAFHDITTGNDTWPGSTGAFFPATGYDLCTGWGSPNGANTINALESYAGPIFVDFNFTGSPQNGKYTNPYQTIAGGVGAVSSGGTIMIKTAGSTPETLTISKPMSIKAIGGTAIIGQ
jgi:subtilase family serine protease